MKKKIISLLLVIAFVLSTTVCVFAADDIRPASVKNTVKIQQIMPGK